MIYYLVLVLLIVLIIHFTTKQENFSQIYPDYVPLWNTSRWNMPLWNMATRIPRLYYDIRGHPNIVYRKLIFGGYSPYGYVFGPYVYDTQGKLLHTNSNYYIA
jgi:hypothetical protein